MGVKTVGGKAKGRPPRPEPVPDWETFTRMLDDTCTALGFAEDDRLARWTRLSKRLGFRAPNYFHHFNDREGAPGWLICWRLAEISGVDILKWYRAAGLLPDHLTSYGRESVEDEAARELDKWNTFRKEFRQESTALLDIAAAFGRARGLGQTSPGQPPQRGRARRPRQPENTQGR